MKPWQGALCIKFLLTQVIHDEVAYIGVKTVHHIAHEFVWLELQDLIGYIGIWIGVKTVQPATDVVWIGVPLSWRWLTVNR